MALGAGAKPCVELPAQPAVRALSGLEVERSRASREKAHIGKLWFNPQKAKGHHGFEMTSPGLAARAKMRSLMHSEKLLRATPNT